MAFTFSRCVVYSRWFARVALAHVIDGNDPETVGHEGPQGENGTFFVSANSGQHFPDALIRTVVLKLYHILYDKSQGMMEKEHYPKEVMET